MQMMFSFVTRLVWFDRSPAKYNFGPALFQVSKASQLAGQVRKQDAWYEFSITLSPIVAIVNTVHLDNNVFIIDTRGSCLATKWLATVSVTSHSGYRKGKDHTERWFLADSVHNNHKTIILGGPICWLNIYEHLPARAVIIACQINSHRPSIELYVVQKMTSFQIMILIQKWLIALPLFGTSCASPSLTQVWHKRQWAFDSKSLPVMLNLPTQMSK